MEQKPRGAMLSRRGFLKAAAATGAAGFAEIFYFDRILLWDVRAVSWPLQ